MLVSRVDTDLRGELSVPTTDAELGATHSPLTQTRAPLHWLSNLHPATVMERDTGAVSRPEDSNDASVG